MLRVQHFQKCRGRIATKIAAKLIDFIKHENGVIRFSAPQALNNSAGQSADVGSPVAADFRFVSYTAQRDADEFAFQRARDGLSQGGLACARRACKAENRSLGIRF